jgi:hypothetical protein
LSQWTERMKPDGRMNCSLIFLNVSHLFEDSESREKKENSGTHENHAESTLND